MKKPVKLDEIVEAMESQTYETYAYLNRETGEIILLTDEEIRAVEEDRPLENYPEWQREVIKMAREILHDSKGIHVQLPTKYEVHEWSIMERFALSIEDEHISDELYYAIRGRGAFRRFKEAIHRFGIADEWLSTRSKL